MLQNAYFLAKIGADTAENEQHFAEILPTDGADGADRRPRAAGSVRLAPHHLQRGRAGLRDGHEHPAAAREGARKTPHAPRAQLSRDPTNFRGLVLGCIEAKFCK